MTQNKDLLFISIFTMITVMAWIVFDVYHAAVTSTITEVQARLIAPLSPKLHDGAMKFVQARLKG
ncbi:MAG: hypothetical protein AAB874_05735 [Patescibacteria group bacterium]